MKMAGDARCGSLVSALIIRSPATLPCSTSWATNTWMTKNYKGVNGKGKGGLTKVTVAPTLTFDSGFWARPQLRFFVTYAKWDKGVSDALDGNYNWDTNTITAGGYSRSGSTDTVNFGVQAEVWF